MSEDSNEQDCTVYIEQLKSDTPSLKLNAASKLGVIASVLGHNRIRDQLIPYLIEIIEQMDNDNDFLIKIAQGLLQLKQYCKSPQQSYILIPPLKILASLDQPAVRDKAVQSLQKLCQGQGFSNCMFNLVFFKTHYYPLIKQLSDQNGPYSPRVSACGLIPICYPNLDTEKQTQLSQIFKRLALKQNSPLVRRALAQNIEAYSRVVSKQISKTDVYEIWKAFITDKIDIVKIKAMQTAVILARFFKKDQINEKFLSLIKGVDPNRKSWRVRYSLAECLSSLLPYLEKEVIKKDVVELFEQLLKDNEPQVRCIALLKTPQVAQKLSASQSYTVFFQYIQKASSDGSLNVKMALVEAIAGFYATIEKQKVIQNGIPIVQSLLKDQNPIIRGGIVERFKQLHDILGQQGTQKYLIPMIQACLNDKKWRFKMSVVDAVGNLLKTLDYSKYKDFINKILNTFSKDHYFAVRQQIFKRTIELKQVFGGQKYFQVVSTIVRNLLNEANYVYRGACITFFSMAATTLEKSQTNQLFLQIVKKLEKEKIANVWIIFLSNYRNYSNILSTQNKNEIKTLMRTIKETITDEDVQFYIERCEF